MLQCELARHCFLLLNNHQTNAFHCQRDKACVTCTPWMFVQHLVLREEFGKVDDLLGIGSNAADALASGNTGESKLNGASAGADAAGEAGTLCGPCQRLNLGLEISQTGNLPSHQCETQWWERP